jgi:transposase
MAAQAPIPESRRKELEEFRRRKLQGFDLRRFLCVWLRESQGMPATGIADALGLKANTVRIIQRDFIARGAQAFSVGKRGPKAPRLMPFEEAEAFLAGFGKDAEAGAVLVAGDIKAALEARLGRRVHKTTVYRMLKRHKWRKVVPRPKHPSQSEEAIEAFKKGASQKGRRRQKRRRTPKAGP